MKIVTYGYDPELMVFDHDQSKIVSAIPVLKRNKHDPIDLGDGIKTYADNVLLEFSTPPSASKVSAIQMLRHAFKKIQAHLGSRYSLVARAAHNYGTEELGPKPEVMVGDLPVEWEIGCNPSMNAYTGREHIPSPFEDDLRTGSFHIHVGWDRLYHMKDKMDAIKLLDLMVGCPSVIFDKDESNKSRRKLYGKCGEFRPTPYGVEWRVLGNYGLRSPRLVELILDLVDHTLSTIEDDLHRKILEGADWNLVKSAIDNNNRKLAEIALEDFVPKKFFPRIFEQGDPVLSKEWGIA